MGIRTVGFVAFSFLLASLCFGGQDKAPKAVTLVRGLNQVSVELENLGDIPLSNIMVVLRGIVGAELRIESEKLDRLNPGSSKALNLSIWLEGHPWWKEKKGSLEIISNEIPSLSRDITLRVSENSVFEFSLAPNYPNPFNSSTNITYRLPIRAEEHETSVTIFDIQGKEIKNLVRTKQGSGEYSVRWDGTDNSNMVAASGIYYVRLLSGPLQTTNKIILTK